jgi:hypothetical protein
MATIFSRPGMSFYVLSTDEILSMQTVTTGVSDLRTFQETFSNSADDYLLAIDQSLLWECAEINRDKWLGIVNSHNSAILSRSKLFENISAQSRLHQNYARNSSTLQWSSTWSTVVQEYRARILTVLEDGIMVFTGIARAAYNIARQTYFADL